MPTIRVDPAELEQVASQVKGGTGLLQTVGPQLRHRSDSLDWETGPKGYVDTMVADAVARATALAEEASGLEQFLLDRAAAFRDADEKGGTHDVNLGDQWRNFFNTLPKEMLGTAPEGPSGPQTPTSEQIRYLQRTLGVQEDGFGPQTQAALQQLGKKYNLTIPPAGQIDPQAWALVQNQAYRAAHDGRPGAPLIPNQLFVPYHSQTDPAYGGVKFGPLNYAEHGCTLTSVSMLIDYHREGFEATKESMTELANRSVNPGGLLDWGQANNFMEEKWGLHLVHDKLPPGSDNLSAAMNGAYAQLQHGEPVVVGIQNGEHQHWVVIRGYTGQGAPSDPSQFLLNDPGLGRKTLADLLTDPNYRGGTIQAIVHAQEAS